MSTATAIPSPTVRSSSRRQPSYSSSAGGHQRTRSSANRASSSGGDSYPEQSPGAHTRGPSASQQQSLAGVARRDYENTNLPQSQTTRRSSSRDDHYATTSPIQRSETSHSSSYRNEPRSSHQRYSSDMSRVAATIAHAGAAPNQARPAAQEASAPLKKRTMIQAQTGSWSLGKTIGQGSMGKVKLARNIETGEQCAIKIVPRQSTDEHQSTRERERADQSKEIRTAREAAIVSLLHHPYICGMRDVVRTNCHWYMLFEYVNGGQMLDYIISHGRLKDKHARKFGRQIASALDYCHRNSIVHRDLKIENILISKTGDIKIIDFGLSNLFSPKSLLKTFCGSLYFAAPELLQAKQYTGPEVDIWSFGIVLYVLVCGKVPFDDQSMPQLHAKIKKGVVDYPAWLTQECKHLISRMLVTDPKQRATLAEVIAHPWMSKGFNAPPESYLPHREAIQLPLDQSVVEKMSGFDFGPPEYISAELHKIILSDEYQTAVRMSNRESTAATSGSDRKRGVFDFYKRRSSISSKDNLLNGSVEALPQGADPTNAYSPLLSVYYLVKEKQERERLESNPGALTIPNLPGHEALKMPGLQAPPAAYTNSNTYEQPGERVTGGRARPRARTQGEDELTEGVKRIQVGPVNPTKSPTIVAPPAPPQSTKKESVAGGLLRRFSTRRGRDPKEVSKDAPVANSPQLNVPEMTEVRPSPSLRRGFSMRKSRVRDLSESPTRAAAQTQPQQNQFLSPPTPGNALTRAGGKLLGRSASVNSAELRRRQAERSMSGIMPSPSIGPSIGEDLSGNTSDRSTMDGSRARIIEVKSTPPTPLVDARPAPDARGSTTRTKSLGHARQESIQARRARRYENRQSNVPEAGAPGYLPDEATDAGENASEMKPVLLKGLFSVSTTSSKPLPAIRTDIIRVLKQLGVEYTEIKGGFSCRHVPSIDLSQVREQNKSSPDSPALMNMSQRRRISFVGFKGSEREKEIPRSTEKSPRPDSRRPRHESSFTGSEDSIEDIRRPAGRAAAGETTTRVESDVGKNLILKFEIFVVKVPLFTLHGIQFKKVSGETWSYKSMAQKILDALRL